MKVCVHECIHICVGLISVCVCLVEREGESEFSEEDEEEMDVEDASMFHFDGRAALLEDKRIQKLAERWYY